MIGRSILVTTNFGFIKRVKSEEYITNQRTVVSTKLEKDDKIIALNIIYEEDTDVIVVSNKGYVLRYPIAEISFYKKLTKGEKAMKLGIDEKLEAVYLTCEVESIHVNDKNVEVDKIKQGHRSTRGTKLRL